MALGRISCLGLVQVLKNFCAVGHFYWPIFIAKNSNKSISCREGMTEHSLTLSARELICSRFEQKFKDRKEFGEDGPVKELVQMQRGKHEREGIFSSRNP